jgi:hypothetical protein
VKAASLALSLALLSCGAVEAGLEVGSEPSQHSRLEHRRPSWVSIDLECRGASRCVCAPKSKSTR